MLWTECETNPTFQNTPARHKLTVLPAADIAIAIAVGEKLQRWAWAEGVGTVSIEFSQRSFSH